MFVTYFVHNVAATVSYDRKELLDIRTAITHLEQDESFFFNESGERDILQTSNEALIPVIRRRKRDIVEGDQISLSGSGVRGKTITSYVSQSRG